MPLESDQEFNCPYCGAAQTLRVDHTGGSRQTFITDCENCCRPMEIELDVDEDGEANLTVKREGEG